MFRFPSGLGAPKYSGLDLRRSTRIRGDDLKYIPVAIIAEAMGLNGFGQREEGKRRKGKR